jgi:hypothetical protein
MSCASVTRMAPLRSSRSANVRVNLSGMCCATSSAVGARAGIRAKMSMSAVGPPVDEPMTTTLRGGTPAGTGSGAGGSASFVKLIRDVAIGRVFGGGTRRLRIICILVRICSLSSCASGDTWRSGFATKSTAPSSSALKTFSFWL